MRIFWLEATPWDPAANAPVTVRACNIGLSAAALINGAPEFYDVLADGLTTSTQVFDGAFTGRVNTTVGSIPINSGQGDIDYWAGLAWSDRPVKIWTQLIETAADITTLAAATVIWDGVCETFDPGISQATIVMSVNRPNGRVANGTYAGSGGREGRAEITGTVKPWAAGILQNRPPVLLDSAKQLFQVHGYGAVTSIDKVREGYRTLDQTRINHTTAADLVLATVPATEIHTCLAEGLFRLGFAPVADITADFTVGLSRPGKLISALLAKAGWPTINIDTASLDAIDAALPYDAWMYDDTGADVADVLDAFCRDIGGYWDVTELGVFYAGIVKRQTPVMTIGPRGQLRDQDLFDIDQLAVQSPYWRNRVGYAYNPRVFSATELGISTVAQSVTDAQNAADAASASAAAAIAELAIIAADSYLSKGEKPAVIKDWQAIYDEYPGMDASAASFGVTTQRTTWQAAYAALSTYLAALSPSLNNTSLDTAIVAATFRGKFTDYYFARTALLQRIADIAAVRAQWAEITGTGKPVTYRVRTRGFEAAMPGGDTHLGLWNEDTQTLIGTVATSYTVCHQRTDLTWGVDYYNVFGNPSDRAAMAARLNEIQNSFSGTAVIVIGWDEPSGGRLDAGIAEQMYRAGASAAVFGSSRFGVRNAYVLVGVANGGEGNGAEYLAGIGSLSRAFIDVIFSITGGVLSIAGKTVSQAADLTYTDGITIEALKPAQAGADVTLVNTAAGIVGQGTLATANSVDYATQVTGSKPAPVDYFDARIANGRIALDASGHLIYLDSANNPVSLGAANLAGLGAGAMAFLNKLTAGNITTFIDNLAINDALIQNLNAVKITSGLLDADRISARSIDTMKLTINGVETSNIYPNAVTQSVSAYTPGAAALYSLGFQTFQTVTISASAGDAVDIIGNMAADYNTGNSTSIEIRITRNGTVLFSTYAWTPQYLCPAIMDTPGAGTFTYNFDARITGVGTSVTLTSRYLRALLTKR